MHRTTGEIGGRPLRTIGSRLAVNAAVVIVAVYVAAYGISTSLVARTTESHRIRNIEILSALYGVLEEKENRFLGIVFPLYDSLPNYDLLTTLLETPAGDPEISRATFRQHVALMLRELADRDDDIEAILIYKASTGERFAYDATYRIFEPAPHDFPFFEQLAAMEPGRTAHPPESWTVGAQRSVTAFGIASSLGTRSIRREAGRFLVAYDLAAFRRVLNRYNVADRRDTRFLVGATGGGVVFDSHPESDPPAAPPRSPGAEAILQNAADGQRLDIDGVPHSVVPLRIRGDIVDAAYVEPVTTTRALARGVYATVFGLCTLFALLAILLYARASGLVARRIHEIDEAMERIAGHDFGHPISVGNRDDELSHIAASLNRMSDELQRNIKRLYINEIRKKSAELNALQASINPHFLFNSIQAACSQARSNDDHDVADFLVLLSSLLRGIVRSKTVITLRKELEFCRIYVELFRLRYGETFEFRFDVDEAVTRFGIPKNVLQPLVENYFVHGLRRNDTDNHLSVRVRPVGETIEIAFEDDGRGIEPDRLAELNLRLVTSEAGGRGMGIANVHRRLRLVYGDAFSLTIHPRTPRGCLILLTIPQVSAERLLSQLNPDEQAALDKASAEVEQDADG